jgi:hypothetical protein
VSEPLSDTTLACYAEPHENLDPDIACMACELLALRRRHAALVSAITRLASACGDTVITDGDTTCTLAWWCRRALGESPLPPGPPTP